MNHGDGNATRVSGISSGNDRSDDFGRAVSRVAVAQVCESVGFQGTKESALDALSDIAIRYLCDLGKMANFNANLTGRTECNVFDIVRALESMEFSQGFPGAADAGMCLVGSGAVKELTRYVRLIDEIPFAQPVARFPVAKAWRRPTPSFGQIGESPPGGHIPPWLPALPDPHTYHRSPVWNERRTDPREDKIELIRQRGKAERSLFFLQQRMVADGGDGIVGPTKQVDGGRNPFLEEPLRPGERGVSAIALWGPDGERGSSVLEALRGPDRDRGSSVLEAFGPAIEAVKNGFCDKDAEDERRLLVLLPKTRPAVNFKIRTAKKYLIESSELSLGKMSSNERTGYWFNRDEERDDKKRRAEFILRQSIENPQDLNQM